MTDTLMSRNLPYGVKDQKQQGLKEIRPYQEISKQENVYLNNISLIDFTK